MAMDLRHWLESPEAAALGETQDQQRRRLILLAGLSLGAAGAAAALQAWWATQKPAAPIGPGRLTTEAEHAALAPGAVVPPPTPAAASTPAPEPLADAASVPKPVEPALRKARSKPKAAEPAPSAPPPVLPPAQGRVMLAVSPWGEVEVDGRPVGVAPPLRQLELVAGPHTITVRNGDAPPQVRQVEVDPDQPTTLKFRF